MTALRPSGGKSVLCRQRNSFKTQGQEESAYENALEPRVRPNPPHKKGCLSDDRGNRLKMVIKMERKLFRFAVIVSVLGLLSIAAVMISGTAYPDMMFQILAPIGLLLMFVSLPLYVLAWVFSIKKEMKSKNYLYATLLLLVGIISIVQTIILRKL